MEKCHLETTNISQQQSLRGYTLRRKYAWTKHGNVQKEMNTDTFHSPSWLTERLGFEDSLATIESIASDHLWVGPSWWNQSKNSAHKIMANKLDLIISNKESNNMPESTTKHWPCRNFPNILCSQSNVRTRPKNATDLRHKASTGHWWTSYPRLPPGVIVSKMEIHGG